MKESWNLLKIISICLLLVIKLSACRDQKKQAFEREANILEDKNLARDNSMDSLLVECLQGINCIAETHLGKKVVFSDEHDVEDPNQILLIPYAALGNKYLSVAYSNVKDGYIIFQPSQAKSFTDKYALNPTNSLGDVINLILLHELGHFKIKKEGAFDNPDRELSGLGEMKMDTEPEHLTADKRVEMSADSVAAAMVKSAAKPTGLGDATCFSTATSVQLVCSSMEFVIFGTRTIENFGGHSILRDPNSSHPNLELRLAFMNQFLNPTPEKQQMIDNYLYDREVSPIHRQEFDPRIFQGMKKELPFFE